MNVAYVFDYGGYIGKFNILEESTNRMIGALSEDGFVYYPNWQQWINNRYYEIPSWYIPKIYKALLAIHKE